MQTGLSAAVIMVKVFTLIAKTMTRQSTQLTAPASATWN